MKQSICKTCDHEFVVKSGSTGKFCSKSCSAKFNNKNRVRSPESKKAYSEYMKITSKTRTGTFTRGQGQNHSGYKHGRFAKRERECIICHTLFIGDTKTCRSKECKRLVCVKSGQCSAAVKIKRSKDEIYLYELINKFIYAEHNLIIKDGWDCGIYIPDLKISIFWNGPWHYKEMKGLTHSLLQVQTRDRIKRKLFRQTGIRVIIFEDRYWNPEQAAQVIKKLVPAVGFEPTRSPL